ncbi:hypothetical protein Tco_0895995 [Tanacetum coccineum]|uniref:Uncharacterized protein n=1 Tax=Tanacetum coccineum TaxID=301880 RepID=A0ABQ5CIK0_9ASTR
MPVGRQPDLVSTAGKDERRLGALRRNHKRIAIAVSCTLPGMESSQGVRKSSALVAIVWHERRIATGIALTRDRLPASIISLIRGIAYMWYCLWRSLGDAAIDR